MALSEQPLANAVFHRHQSCHRFRRLGAIFAAVPFHCRQMLRKHLVFCILQKVNDVLQTDNVGYLNAIGLLNLLNCRSFAETLSWRSIATAILAN